MSTPAIGHDAPSSPPSDWVLGCFVAAALLPVGAWACMLWFAAGLHDQQRQVFGLTAGCLLPPATWGGAIVSLALGIDLRRRGVGWRRKVVTLGLFIGCAPAVLWAVGAGLVELLGWSVGV